MNEKEGEAEKTNHYRSFVFGTKKTRKQRREICKTFFFSMNGSDRQRKQETKRNNRDKQPKG